MPAPAPDPSTDPVADPVAAARARAMAGGAPRYHRANADRGCKFSAILRGEGPPLDLPELPVKH